jgi:hypothetical protein
VPAGQAQVLLVRWVGVLNGDPTRAWHVLVDALAFVGSYWLARRGHPAAALYLGIFGLLDLKSELAYPGGPTSALTAPGAFPFFTDFWWMLACTLLGLYWLAHRQLTQARLVGLLFVFLVLELLRQTSFISSPFSPFFGFAGVGFLAFGLVWDALTSGSWANVSTPGLPRTSRIFLYLGYVLLSVTVVNWVLSAHDLTQLNEFTGDVAVVGLNRFGRPLLFAIFAATLALPAEGHTRPEVPTTEGQGSTALTPAPNSPFPPEADGATPDVVAAEADPL